MIGSKKTLVQNYPHVDKDWAADLLLELRLRDISGARIGDILTEVESHCAASGQKATEAFGDPQEYAMCLDFEGQQRTPVERSPNNLTPAVLALLCGFAVSAGLTGALDGQPVEMRTGALVAVLMSVGYLLAAVHYLNMLLRSLWRWMTAFMAFFCAVVALLLWGGPVVFTAPALPLTVGGSLLLVVFASVQTFLQSGSSADPIVNPGESLSPADAREAKWIVLGGIWAAPLLIPTITLASWHISH
ncbi:hypothetical protein SAMN05421595_1666 [Austwickia chelonae]|uniref:Uncharacterized protein n=1 Tax=Austwickia chelonae NBRC 105200 TaxID=1184607 RepID=K6V3B7_9MICO|nr:hypothetical protein [Austwickia chelonae]GAB76538.1 hypothetical protein AUCHE_01_01000 [Austwickia chelonae NBRC 105200]SEW26419.1 hypothetical protein SAMN05421595_1666 [Austwickia chelonae]